MRQKKKECEPFAANVRPCAKRDAGRTKRGTFAHRESSHKEGKAVAHGELGGAAKNSLSKDCIPNDRELARAFLRYYKKNYCTAMGIFMRKQLFYFDLNLTHYKKKYYVGRNFG
ncbi:MAG: hypothetical protein H7Y38_12690 [Armatimonadetes bacterium]|nr:hypothetical protein [Armatimonadota bacterium]